MELNNTSVKEQEVAETATEIKGGNGQEVAEPEKGS